LTRLGKFDGSKNDIIPAIDLSLPLVQTYSIAIDINTIGVDIEETGRMPESTDFRADKFYTMNFSPSEISYCILQVSPLVSFAGLFAVKEAITKANGIHKSQAFNTIVIDHLPGGKPIHPDFYISISHTANLAIAVAIQKNILTPYSPIKWVEPHTHAKSTSLLFIVSFSAILLAIITLLLVILRA
jgi:phosphopantetheine--protein transferase-like protein